MKTKKLIELLNEEDPTGELEACINNIDIFTVGVEPAYYDGSLQVLERNEDCEYYNVVGAKYTNHGQKLVISPMSISDAIFNHPDIPISYAPESLQNKYGASIQKKREQSIEISNDVKCQHFEKYVIGKCKKQLETANIDYSEEFIGKVRAVATKFYDENFHADSVLPKDIIKMSLSRNDMDEVWWDRTIDVIVSDDDIAIEFINGKRIFHEERAPINEIKITDHKYRKIKDISISDNYGAQLTIRPNEIKDNSIWLNITKPVDEQLKDYYPSKIKLNKEQIALLLPYLQNFVEEGKLVNE